LFPSVVAFHEQLPLHSGGGRSPARRQRLKAGFWRPLRPPLGADAACPLFTTPQTSSRFNLARENR
jgi:hypothetical protein